VPLLVLALVIVVEWAPVYGYLRAAFHHEPLAVSPVMVISFLVVIGVCVAATVVPLRIALRRIERFEF
jgi:hypothetical protein